jgi:hypothetical protein
VPAHLAETLLGRLLREAEHLATRVLAATLAAALGGARQVLMSAVGDRVPPPLATRRPDGAKLHHRAIDVVA